MSLTPAREIAYDAFTAVLFDKKKPEEFLEQLYLEQNDKIKRLDRNFIMEIVYGSLRWYGKIFWILQKTSKRDLKASPPEVQTALVLGTYQIYYMDRVPDRAAVNESVEYVRKKGHANAVSFVNGILRQIARRAEYFAKPDPKTQPVEYLSLQFAHPEWMVRRWAERFKFEKLEQILASHNQPPPITIRWNALSTQYGELIQLQEDLLRKERIHSERRPLRLALRLKSHPPTGEGSLFAGGHYTYQDEASQLISFLVNPEPDQVVVDTCAGPGGKLTHLFEAAKGQLQLIAVEKNPRQMLRAQQNMQRMGHDKVSWVEQDFMLWKADKPVDKILLDAPCSGLGVLRRHPEGKWQKQEEAIRKLAGQQWEMILHALKQLKVGGELIYSVCSFETEETENHLKRIADTMGDQVEIISPVSRLPDYYKKYVTRNNLLHIYPGNQDDMDGFGAFVIKLKAPF